MVASFELLGQTTMRRLWHSLNTDSPNSFKLSGSVIDSMAVSAKALWLKLTTWEPVANATVFRFSRFSQPPTSITGLPSMVAGISSPVAPSSIPVMVISFVSLLIVKYAWAGAVSPST